MPDLKLKDVRLSFPTLGEPEYYQGKKQRPDDQRRWSGTFLIPTGSPMKEQIEEVMKEVAKAKWGAKWEAVWNALDGDTKLSCFTDGKKKAYEGYQGHWALTSHRKESEGRPGVFDTDRSPIFYGKNATGKDGEGPNDMYPGKAGRVYGGCYVNAHVNFWAQDNSNGKGIRCELVAIQRNRDGDAFSGGMAPDADQFDEITEGADADDLS